MSITALEYSQIINVLMLCLLANLCNSTIIEIYGDIIRVSHGFDGCQMLEYIADTQPAAMRAGNDDITSFLRPLKLHRCWRYMASDHKHGNSWNQPIADKK